ncbi:hypothetical protein HGRIS_002602 [Hohenbuehelia grisea]|uniref:Inositol phospholipid synthesis and fat-storage-inducing TM-domain-containing protein n=1 Tax=Hohenbuehelia grisea TaxID=104357 RepID=A0ABR3JN23_9AGAR
MPKIISPAFVAVSVILLVGTTYSVLQNTYLDTSNPLLAHLPHPLHATHYFANKANFLNVMFIKRAWAWTTGAFLLAWLTAPGAMAGRFVRWLAATAVWLAFTSWFFGPALLERVIVASGGECVLALPSGDTLSVPQEYCFTKSTISTDSHPHLFTTSTFVAPEAGWGGKPRLRRGHDVSGHVFLLTMSVLFLAEQLRPSFRVSRWSTAHACAVAANAVLIGIWLFSLWTTGLYFHTPLEKFTGYVLGVLGFAVSQLPPA